MTSSAERDLPSYRVQAPHFTGETMPNRLNGMSEVARLLSDVDGNRTCGPLVKVLSVITPQCAPCLPRSAQQRENERPGLARPPQAIKQHSPSLYYRVHQPEFSALSPASPFVLRDQRIELQFSLNKKAYVELFCFPISHKSSFLVPFLLHQKSLFGNKGNELKVCIYSHIIRKYIYMHIEWKLYFLRHVYSPCWP